MNELYQSPKQPEAINLHNTEVKLDMHRELYAAKELGITENDQYSFSVAAEVVLPDDVNPGPAIALVKALNKQFNRVELFAVGLNVDADGKKSIAGSHWMPVEPGQKYSLGRRSENEPEEVEDRITGEKLFGVEFPNTVSRKHLDIELAASGELIIGDHSANGTKVAGHEVVKTQEVPIKNFAEAKAYKRYQDSQEPEAKAAAEEMQRQASWRAAEQARELAEQARRLAENPDAITEVPKP